ncbi:hypothetical protein EG329_000910 [Mollisiaceae sp. DMI_Dod_QoI]|nr:hypothetical protein EG329_000910 [Helotiales sp. DMI_Dod_QoI]
MAAAQQLLDVTLTTDTVNPSEVPVSDSVTYICTSLLRDSVYDSEELHTANAKADYNVYSDQVAAILRDRTSNPRAPVSDRQLTKHKEGPKKYDRMSSADCQEHFEEFEPMIRRSRDKQMGHAYPAKDPFLQRPLKLVEGITHAPREVTGKTYEVVHNATMIVFIIGAFFMFFLGYRVHARAGRRQRMCQLVDVHLQDYRDKIERHADVDSFASRD